MEWERRRRRRLRAKVAATVVVVLGLGSALVHAQAAEPRPTGVVVADPVDAALDAWSADGGVLTTDGTVPPAAPPASEAPADADATTLSRSAAPQATEERVLEERDDSTVSPAPSTPEVVEVPVPPPVITADAVPAPPPVPGTPPVVDVRPSPGDAPPLAPVASVDGADAVTVEVQPGEHLWGIAEEQVTSTADPRTVIAYWTELVALNADVLAAAGGADHVEPGLVLQLPI